MAVAVDAVGQGAMTYSELNTRIEDAYTHTATGGDLCALAALAFTATDLRLGPFVIGDNELDDLTRRVKYGDIEMTSIGVQQWDTQQGWTEVFAAVGVPPGPARVWSAVGGGAPSQRVLRIGAVTLSGVDSIGTPILGDGDGTTMSISATASQAERIVGVFGSRSGMTDFGGDLHYLQSSRIGLMIGSIAGTGSAAAVAAAKQKAGKWGGIAVPVLAADTIATCDPLIIEPNIGVPVVRRAPRPGGLRRQVFSVPVE